MYDGDDEEEMSLSLSKKESVFDYFDDGEESVGEPAAFGRMGREGRSAGRRLCLLMVGYG